MFKKLKWLVMLLALLTAIGTTTVQSQAAVSSSHATTSHVSGGRSSGARTSTATRSVSPRSPAGRTATATRSVASRSAANRTAANRSVSNRSAATRSAGSLRGRSVANRSAVNRSVIEQQREISRFSPKQRSSQSNYLKMYNGFKTDSKRGIYSPSDYLYNPYQHGFYNYYYYNNILNQDKHVAQLSGIDVKKIDHPKTTTYWINVKNKKGKIAKVLVNKSQYGAIKVNDDVKLVANKLIINGKAI